MAVNPLEHAGRRRLLKSLALAPFGAWFVRSPAALAAEERERFLSFYHTHTDERLKVVYFAGGEYLPESLDRVQALLRDFRNGEVHAIDPRLLDILYALRLACGGGTFDVISGYRSTLTNRLLLASGGVSPNSLHTKGKAIDVRLSGCDTARLCAAALALQAGGVGYYPVSDFVHLDTGRVRKWEYRAG